ncbi:hypothetical protein V2H45_03020 [Tumidithrix elongata RA019]|uniref:Uncharacterized protein n=1 Tax=Tumidithrix elongata BACA0141 TaxID=2716417 RepID=A0AAW9PVE0_9CYAN|nr:hypothetical protein [Tumidithrix elongata RA019]
MGQAWNKVKKRRQAKSKLAELMSKAEQVIVIHYSCESFYDRPDGSSPRITSIAVRNLESGQTTSFSIHQVAERKGYSASALEQHYNELEKLMLDEFYAYVRLHGSHFWLHWNMRDINYGFPAIAHRYKVLQGDPEEINESKLVDLSRLLIAIYGDNYIPHTRLSNLIDKNSISNKDFLNGKDEAEAFDKKQYVKLHQSTLRKVDVLSSIIERTADGSLKTNSKKRDLYGNYFTALTELIKENPIISGAIALIGFVSAVISFFK